ncbi:unnamed protein product [Cunninghamella blakesleeana]
MLNFPSLNFLHSSTSEWIQQNQEKVKERYKQNQNMVKFEHFDKKETPNKRIRTNNACEECRRKKKKCTGGTKCESCKKLSLNCSQGGKKGQPSTSSLSSLTENKINNDRVNSDNQFQPQQQYIHQYQFDANNNHHKNKSKMMHINDNYNIENDKDRSSSSSQLFSQPQSPLPIPIPPSTSSPNNSIQIIHHQNGLTSTPPPPPPPSSSSIRSDANFPHYLFQKSSFSSDGQYYGGTSVFITDFNQDNSNDTSSSFLNESTQIIKSPSQYLSEQGLCKRDQYYLLEVYHYNVDSIYPMFNLKCLKKELESTTPNDPLSFSILFYLALFIRASYLVKDEISSHYGFSYGVFSTWMTIEFNLQRDIYLSLPNPTCSTILALTIMSNHMAFNCLRHQLPYAINYIAEACNVALSIGLHASEPAHIDPNLYQLRLRTFWITFITDYTIKTIHGRPYAIDEGDIDLDRGNPFNKHPDNIKCTPHNNDVFAETWLTQLKCTIDLTKGVGKTVRFNYSPQRKRDQQHQFYVGYISSLDHWVCDFAKERLLSSSSSSDSNNSSNNNNNSNKPGLEEQSNKSNSYIYYSEKMDIEIWKERLEYSKKLYIHTSLMLIHKRFIDDESIKHGSRPSSLEICLHAAIEVIHITYNMETSLLESLSTSPLTIYSMMMSLQILQSLFTNKIQDDYMVAQAEIQFEIGYSVLQRLMICHNPQSMIYHTLCHLWKKYKEHRAGLFHHQQNNEELLHKPNARLSTSINICHPLNAFISGTRHIPGVPVTVAHYQALTNNTTITTLSTSHPHPTTFSTNDNNTNNTNNNTNSNTNSNNTNNNHAQKNHSSSSSKESSKYPLNSSSNTNNSSSYNNTNQPQRQQSSWKIKEYHPNKSIPTPTISPSSSSSLYHS